MPFDLSLIKTVFIVMMENRSFDHLLGYLSLDPAAWANVDGLHADPAWLDRAASVHQGSLYRPFEATDPYDLMKGDPPHERDPIANQMGTPVNGVISHEWLCGQLRDGPRRRCGFPGIPTGGHGLFHQGTSPGD